ncbi:hypothetical protein [Leptospira noguchii]|uniref:hypothetical protein n=1 Tax=Leptospira noguchii TaxID=28182 RepID=UPI00032863B3|nr:hypothetical protein [Leptospira noguchii]EMS86191.1 hypothetical protein LEP1GSC074_0633 [Leptospira noguchii str. Hook]UOG50937.1 hypothetical protein MAL00_19820 [Leptospira noguchii]
MKRFLYILFLFNCSTFGSVSTQTNLNPSHDTGCSEFKGPSWFLCLEKLHANWQKIESSQATVTILSKEREGEYLRLKKRICWSEFFCREFEEVTYSPTFFQRLKVTLSTILISICIGLLIGISF